ncbi:4'-phosphopantetheinyl transferase superfamily protein [Pseudonocardia kujensis]|uniref:4'-phosphopantetheinyl transferase family protein n=1 Tax=Pseudonocardia kujensis TaxID=1128675 RepID=UPI001E3BDDCF|nr:4'-phosphopantetheinyl transferase superfamily protein [Pseudonocardia kujensis]MCE0762843.1 4'-phosphopantetheinyl transferase superfamily protein [Pseudonocardia kujensis]
MVDVWWARPVDPSSAPRLVALLDAHERTRLGAFRRPADQARYLAAHALTRLLLGARLDTDPAAIALDRTCECGKPHGKPRLATGTAPAFSLTHSGRFVGVALSDDGPVGLDVEELRALSDLDRLAEHTLSPAERTRPPADTRAFLTIWTRKEALLKATGKGLASPMDAITLSPTGGVEAWTDGPGAAWVVDLEAGPDHPAALAGLGGVAPEVRVHDGDALLR